MKIAIFSDTFPPQINGVANMAHHSALALTKAGHEVKIYTVSRKKEKELLKKNEGFKITTLPSLNFPPYPGERMTLPIGLSLRSIFLFRPDIIHIHTPFAVGIEGIFCAKIFGIPVVGTHHTFFDHYLKHIYLDYNWAKKLSWKVTVAFYNKMDTIISPTKSLAEELQKNGLRKPLEIIQNTVDSSLFHPTQNSENNKNIKKKYEILEKSIVYMGRLSYEKNIQKTIRIFAEILKEIPTTKLMIIGDGPEKEKLEELTRELKIEKSIIFTGFLSGQNLVDYLSINDLFLTTSESENMPLAVLEAMSVGLPIIAGSSLGMKEIVLDGENGYLVNSDSDQFLEKILDLLKNDAKREQFKNASKTLSLQYSEPEIIKKIIELYQKVINAKK